MITITTVEAPNGWLGNMSGYPIVHGGKKYKTAEALFQAQRFSDLEVKEIIRLKPSPMQAKWAAKAHKEEMVVAPCSEEDLDNMPPWFCTESSTASRSWSHPSEDWGGGDRGGLLQPQEGKWNVLGDGRG